MIITFSCNDEDDAQLIRSRLQPESAFYTCTSNPKDDHIISAESEETAWLVNKHLKIWV